MGRITKYILGNLIIFSTVTLFSEEYPDQSYNFESIKGVTKYAKEIVHIVETNDGAGLKLLHKNLEGYIVFKENISAYPFNEVLPSWNGFVPDNQNSSFKVQMRFYQHNNWSPWVTVGYWKNNIWTDYGATKWADGRVDIDVVNLKTYTDRWQFKVIMKRDRESDESPVLNSLSFFVSDSETTDNFKIDSVLDDNPEPIYYNTNFINQYSVDKDIGNLICSPVVVTMILGSYNFPVNTLEFAEDNLDPYWGIYGVWPRSVQNGVKYGLKGSVTRYRNWSQVRDVLSNNGRVAITVGKPLYSGHLLMIVGFDVKGNPIVHDPGRNDGNSYVFNKKDLSNSWFNKGGIAYTFYLK